MIRQQSWLGWPTLCTRCHPAPRSPSLLIRSLSSQRQTKLESRQKPTKPVSLSTTEPTTSSPLPLESSTTTTRENQDRNASFLRTYKPRTPGLRHLKRPINDHLHKGRPFLPLTFPRRGQHIGGRNHSGQVTVRHRGGGAKRRIRIVDFVRQDGGQRVVERIEHDPGRNAHVALLRYDRPESRDQAGILAPARVEYSYIVAAQGMRAGDTVESFRSGIPERILLELGSKSSKNANIKGGGTGSGTDAGMLATKTAFRGNCLPLGMIPPGTNVYCVGLKRGGKAQLCRAAGSYATVVSKNDGAAARERENITDGEDEGEVRRYKNAVDYQQPMVLPIKTDTDEQEQEQGIITSTAIESTDDEATAPLIPTSSSPPSPSSPSNSPPLPLTPSTLKDRWANYVNVKLKSGETRRIHREACATIGIASNINHHRGQFGKAGRKRWLGIRPTVRGVAMNACDHPHGGGRGKSKGNRHPVSIWGQLTKSGYKTRDKNKANAFLVTARPRMQGKSAKKAKKKKEGGKKKR